ncbi:MAG TPA: hypothetical protein VIJ66_09635 [Solirubrobacteraceae bacterium]
MAGKSHLAGMPDPIADAIKGAEYLEQRCPVTTGPSLLEEREGHA